MCYTNIEFGKGITKGWKTIEQREVNGIRMEFYFAPMEGITGYIYRNAHHRFFPGTDKYFTPFLSPNQNRALNPKEVRDVLPENNEGIYIVPQILTNQADFFLRAAKELKECYGYEEVNLNLGCPSGTVVSKGKGAGFLADPGGLDAFFDQVYAKADVKVSVKTRIGLSSPEEFYGILDIFNRYPLHELIIHPRVRNDFYKNKPNREIFAEAVRLSKNPLCYNGDIFTLADYADFGREFPAVGKVMLGRGLLANPALVQDIRQWEQTGKVSPEREYAGAEFPGAGVCGTADKKRLREFHDWLYAAYKEAMSGDTNLLFKMKELWSYMACLFTDYEKYWKKIKKASRLCDYREAVERLFVEQELRKWRF